MIIRRFLTKDSGGPDLFCRILAQNSTEISISPNYHEALVFISSDDGVSEASVLLLPQLASEIGALIVGVSGRHHSYQVASLSLVRNPTSVTRGLLELRHVVVQI